MSKGTKLLIGALVAISLVPLTVATYYRGVRGYTLTDSLYSGFLGWMTDTRWAKGYSEGQFSQIRVGMTREEVRKTLGEPIFQPDSNYWGYTFSPSSTHYHQRGVVFSPSGTVTQMLKGFYFD